jgi:hypothetical protein
MNARTHAVQPRSLVALWLGVLGPPAIWLAQFELKYALASRGETTWRTLALLAASIVSLALVAMLAAMSWRHRRIAARSPLDAAAGVTGRNRFFATLGTMSSALFFLLIVAQALADFFFNPGRS